MSDNVSVATAIPTPAELLREPEVDYANRIAVRVAEVVAALRLAPRKPVTVRVG